MNLGDSSSQINEVVVSVSSLLQEAVLGIYLHGSAVQSQLRAQSDIDLLVITARPMMERERRALTAAFVQVSGRHPRGEGEPRCLEVMIFDRNGQGIRSNPAQTEIVYGEWLRDSYDSGEAAGPTVDPENTLILAQARKNSLALLGPKADQLLPDIPVTAVREAMRDSLPALLDGLNGDERNVLLTLARMWWTSERGDFATKDAAASWAYERLPEPEASILDYARRAYLGEIADAWEDKQAAARSVAGYLREQIARLL